MVKMISTTGHWVIVDNARSPYNVVDDKLAANLAEAENGSNTGGANLNSFDFLSNGFKCRSNTGSTNSSGQTYIYYAVAENPFSLNGGMAR